MSKKWRIRLFHRMSNTFGATYKVVIIEANSQKEASDKLGVSLHFFKGNAVRIKD